MPLLALDAAPTVMFVADVVTLNLFGAVLVANVSGVAPKYTSISVPEFVYVTPDDPLDGASAVVGNVCASFVSCITIASEPACNPIDVIWSLAFIVLSSPSSVICTSIVWGILLADGWGVYVYVLVVLNDWSDTSSTKNWYLTVPVVFKAVAVTTDVAGNGCPPSVLYVNDWLTIVKLTALASTPADPDAPAEPDTPAEPDGPCTPPSILNIVVESDNIDPDETDIVTGNNDLFDPKPPLLVAAVNDKLPLPIPENNWALSDPDTLPVV